MTHILLYTPPPYKNSGGLGNFKLFYDIILNHNYSIFLCPILTNISSVGFFSPFHNRSINSIQQQEIYDYYLKTDKPCDIVEKQNIVTVDILRNRNNVVIYPEDIIGNPSEQKYIIRWLFYFPIPTALNVYNFQTEYICFFSDYIYNLYKYVCLSCGISDLLTTRVNKINIYRVFKFEPEIYKNIPKRIINSNLNTNKKCFTIRKFFPPITFRAFNKGCNINYTREIFINHKNKLSNIFSQIKNTNNIIKKQNLNKELTQLKKNPPNTRSDSVVREYLTHKFKKMGYDQIEHQTSSQDFINYFLKKDFFLTFDPFTFMAIIASLCGCISVIKKIDIVSYDEWMNCDPFIKYGIAYGNEGIQHAKDTQHLLLEHILNLYLQNTQNSLNLIYDAEIFFNIKINKK